MWEPVEVVGLLARAGLLTGLGLKLATTTRPYLSWVGLSSSKGQLAGLVRMYALTFATC